MKESVIPIMTGNPYENIVVSPNMGDMAINVLKLME